MKASETGGISVRLVACIYQRPTLHRVDALQLGEKITTLRDLKTGLDEMVLFFPAVFARTAENLPRHEKTLDARGQLRPRQRARKQIVFVATVAMPAKIRIIFI